MSQTIVPAGYRPALDLYDTQNAIGRIHQTFEDLLSEALNLKRVSAPLFVEASTGLNDNLNGVERPVDFEIKETGTHAEVVHSLAKWKRMALYRYGFRVGKGLYTDMNAIRRDEEMDNCHSIYVDQWDWEKVISIEQRTIDYLKETVNAIVGAICVTSEVIRNKYRQIETKLERDVAFITTRELEYLYPTMTPKQREDAFLRQNKTACIMQIGVPLKDGKPHDGRAPDYDDWELNCDIMFWNPVLERAFELSSMGIRVSPESLDRQLKSSGCDSRRELTFHKMLLAGELPYTMGGGIGQSRLCMLLLDKAHIGEVQSSVWDAETIRICAEAGVPLL